MGLRLNRVFVITSAGVSAESGIPTFRGTDGYWSNLDPAKLATPEAFARDLKLVWSVTANNASAFMLRNRVPTPTRHCGVRRQKTPSFMPAYFSSRKVTAPVSRL